MADREERDQAISELHDFIQSKSTTLGPADDEENDGSPMENAFLTQWVLVTAWVDENGQTFLTRLTPKEVPQWQRQGLLHEGLYGFGDYGPFD